MYVVAHPDDSLLFQSPALLEDIAGKSAVLTLHLTAGDSGSDEDYWKGREAGIGAAYAQMSDVANEWTSFALSAGDHQVALDVLAAAPHILVAFMRLPDGGYPAGDGYPRYHRESLTKLWRRPRSTATSVDGLNTYTRRGLIDTLAAVMNRFQPRRMAVLDYVNAFSDEDHQDHYAAACFSVAAHRRCTFAHELVGYAGYPGQRLPENVTGALLRSKQDAFFAYGRFDPRACSSEASCSGTPYAAWLRRQYVVDSETAGDAAAARSE
jgi:LmbE family N-acetylglucosaminyl deacetylase